VVISELMKFLNEIEKNPNKESLIILLKLLAPICPHLSEELYQHLKNKSINKEFKSIFQDGFPKFKLKDIKQKAALIIIQINGKLRAKLDLPYDLPEQKVKELALNLPKISSYISSPQMVKKVVFIKNKLINFVI
jgi:leucyl-tRNA synthetase